MKRYKITITEYSTEITKQGKDWTRIMSDEQAEAKDVEAWGYTPEIEKEKTIEREIFKQNIADLDLTLVIKAVNGI